MLRTDIMAMLADPAKAAQFLRKSINITGLPQHTTGKYLQSDLNLSASKTVVLDFSW